MLRKDFIERDIYSSGSSFSSSSSSGASKCAGNDHDLSFRTVGAPAWFKPTESLTMELVPIPDSRLSSQVLDGGDFFVEETEVQSDNDSVVDKIVVECGLSVELSGLPGVKNVVNCVSFVWEEKLDDRSVDINDALFETTSSGGVDFRS